MGECFPHPFQLALFINMCIHPHRPPAPSQRARPHVDASDKNIIAADPDLKSRVCFGNPTSGEDPAKISKLEMLRGVPRFAPLFGLCTNPRIASVAEQLLGEEARLMKDKYIFKTAGQGQGFTPHQDMQLRRYFCFPPLFLDRP